MTGLGDRLHAGISDRLHRNAHGVERDQAEAIAKAIRSGQGELVTKDDLDAKLADLETRLVERENRLVKWAVALAGAVVIILGAIIRWT